MKNYPSYTYEKLADKQDAGSLIFENPRREIMTTYFIGIDPDKGYAIWCKESKCFLTIETTAFWQIICGLESLLTMRSNSNNHLAFSVYIEAPHQTRPTWEHKNDESARKQSKISSNVGENKAKAKLLVEYCKMKNILVTECKPTKRSMTKLKADQFEKITGYKGETSEHGRDAAMLVFGR